MVTADGLKNTAYPRLKVTGEVLRPLRTSCTY
ncbi:MAG: hypothetical protein ACD_24C00518G0006, partial [uncultured bacterium]